MLYIPMVQEFCVLANCDAGACSLGVAVAMPDTFPPYHGQG